MIDHGFVADMVTDSVCARGHSISFEVYGPGVLHNDHPALEITIGDSPPTVVWADSYDDLLAALDRLRERVADRSTRP